MSNPYKKIGWFLNLTREFIREYPHSSIRLLIGLVMRTCLMAMIITEACLTLLSDAAHDACESFDDWSHKFMFPGQEDSTSE